MTNEDLKLEAIKKAYSGAFLDVALELCDEHGWINIGDYYTYFPQDTESDGEFKRRPKALSGLESNAGWIRIKEDGSNLPKGRTDVWVKQRNDFVDIFTIGKQFNFGRLSELEYILTHFTHYQPIIKPELPLW